MDNDLATSRPSGTERRLRARGARREAWARDRRVLSAASAALVLVASSLAGCGGSSAPSRVAATRQACQEVAAVLSDGPDPDADPVGYAEAQIRQLRLLHTSQQPVGRTIGQLASAYQAYSSSDGTNAAAKRTADHAIQVMNAICPGAGATL